MFTSTTSLLWLRGKYFHYVSVAPWLSAITKTNHDYRILGKKPSKGLSAVLFRLFMLGGVDIKRNVTGAIFY